MTRTVLITGATSGFGAATARRFAKSGWRVVANGRRAERLESLVHELGTDTVTAAVFDVRDAPLSMPRWRGYPSRSRESMSW